MWTWGGVDNDKINNLHFWVKAVFDLVYWILFAPLIRFESIVHERIDCVKEKNVATG